MDSSFTAVPVVSPEAGRVVGLLGQSLTLSFNIIRDIPAVTATDIQWMLRHSNGTEVAIPLDDRGTFSSDRRSLTITPVDHPDEGLYVFMASNAAGSATGSIFVDVQCEWLIQHST